jgi:hypothetical protein
MARGEALSCLRQVVGGARQHVGQAGAALGFLRGAGALGRAALVLGHRQAVLLGQLVHCLDEAGAGVVHQKADGVAVRLPQPKQW